MCFLRWGLAPEKKLGAEGGGIPGGGGGALSFRSDLSNENLDSEFDADLGGVGGVAESWTGAIIRIIYK